MKNKLIVTCMFFFGCQCSAADTSGAIDNIWTYNQYEILVPVDEKDKDMFYSGNILDQKSSRRLINNLQTKVFLSIYPYCQHPVLNSVPFVIQPEKWADLKSLICELRQENALSQSDTIVFMANKKSKDFSKKVDL